MPVKAAGWRIEPPVSVPVRAGAEPGRDRRTPSRPTSRRATELHVRPSLRRHGEITVPKYEVSFDEPMANSSMLSLPSIPRRRATDWR